jgi:cyclopropane fatty-acyl-phospholipid synthase-like methyltransferase
MLKRLRSVVRMARAEHRNASYSYDPADTVVADFAEFAKCSVDDVEAAIRSYHVDVRREWKSLPGSSFSNRSEAFYGASSSYIFDIIHGARSKQAVIEKLDKFSPLLLDVVREHAGNSLLDFGGGAGVFCEIAHDFGKDVTYVDIPGRLSDFAAWRFAKYQLPIRVQMTNPEAPTIVGTYDIVHSDAVLEHLPEEKQFLVVDAMCRALNERGLLVLLVDLSGPTRDNPTHSIVDIGAIHAHIERLGLINLFGARHFCSVWQKPAGGRS